MDVPAQFQPPLPRVYHHRFEPALKQVPAAPVTPVEPHAVTHIEPLTGPAEVRFGQLHHQMVVIVHQHKRVQANPKPAYNFPQQFAEMHPVPIVPKNRPPFIAPGAQVIPPARSLNP